MARAEEGRGRSGWGGADFPSDAAGACARRGGPARLGSTIAVLAGSLSLALACAHAQEAELRATEKAPDPTPARHETVEARDSRRHHGLASYYAPSLAGRPTASGEPYDPDDATAAHRRLPFGTVVRVERLDSAGEPTGAAVRVRINDRGPFVEGRIIDLSGSAARELGIEEAGVVPVRLEVLSRP